MTKKTTKVKKTTKAKVKTAPEKPVEEVIVEEVTKEEIKDPQVESAKETGEYPPKAEESTESKTIKIESKNPEPITPEVVEPIKKEKEEKVENIGKNLRKVTNGERIDHNHAIDLMKMIREEHMLNPSSTPELQAAMKKQFDVMSLIELIHYNAQVEDDFQQLGIKVNDEQFIRIEQLARETLGITLKGLPALNKQMVINFSESLDNETKETAKAEVEAQKKVPEIPKADPTMSEADKLNVMRSIMSMKNGIGNNINNLIEWTKKAYSFKESTSKATILAFVFQRDFRTTLSNALREMVYGKLNNEHSILGAHALLHKWLPKDYSEQDISDIVKVCLAYKEEMAAKDYKKKVGKEVSTENGLALIQRNIVAGNTTPVLDAILAQKKEVVVEYPDKVGSVRVNIEGVRKSLVDSYGESIIKDKISELVKYYVNPIMRLSNYVDKSAYNA